MQCNEPQILQVPLYQDQIRRPTNAIRHYSLPGNLDHSKGSMNDKWIGGIHVIWRSSIIGSYVVHGRFSRRERR